MSEFIPTISVLMPVYNSAQYLRQAVESILAQTFTDFEFLIIDDGSTDASLKILQTYAAQDQRIHLTTRENRGLARSLNQMLTYAKGEFIARMDGDDIAMPERFARQVEFLRREADVVCVGSAMDWIDEQSRFLGHCPVPESDQEIQRWLLGGISLLHHPCAMARRASVLEVGGYNETMMASSDLDLWLRLGEIGRLANLTDMLLQYRLHQQSITHANQVRQGSDALAACQRAWQRRGIEGEFIRKPADHLNQHDFWLKCGWHGFLDGQREVARRCGMRAIAIQPLALEGWKLLACALVKPLPISTET
jgi:glycosyltransferase involved in cell wall biosynthesis